jgi:hypothetical protein
MRVALLAAGVGFLALVPTGTAVLLIFFSDNVALVPVWFWLVWLVISLGVALEAPALADALALPRRGTDGLAFYAKWAAGLGVLNVASALTALFFIVANKPPG